MVKTDTQCVTFHRLVGDDVILKVKRIDEGGIDGDLCCLVSTEDLSVVSIVWPTAQKLKQLRVRRGYCKSFWAIAIKTSALFALDPDRRQSNKITAGCESALEDRRQPDFWAGHWTMEKGGQSHFDPGPGQHVWKLILLHIHTSPHHLYCLNTG